MFVSFENIIVESMSEGMMTINKRGVIEFINQAGCGILGMERVEIVGQKVGLFFLASPANDHFVQLIIDASRNLETVKEGTVTLYSKDGIRYVKAAARSELREEEAGKGILTTICFQDVTEFVLKSGIGEELSAINAMNKSLNLRNQLIQRVFGCFVLRQKEDADFLTSDLAGRLNRGIMKSVTILQSDLRSYTAISSKMDPDSLIAMMGHYIAEMSERIYAHHGSVVEFYGDGIVASFGAFGHEDEQYDDAVLAAIEMQKAMPGVNAWNREHGFPDSLKMGIGIDSGDAILGFVGKNNLKTYDVIGDVVGRADEIQSHTVEGQIFLSEAVRDSMRLLVADEIRMDMQLSRGKNTDRISQILSVGDGEDRMSCPDFSGKMEKLTVPEQAAYYIMSGKQREKTPRDGYIFAVSDTEMKFSGSDELTVFTNIELSFESMELYAKVIRILPDGVLLNLTYTPPEFFEWKKSRKDKV